MYALKTIVIDNTILRDTESVHITLHSTYKFTYLNVLIHMYSFMRPRSRNLIKYIFITLNSPTIFNDLKTYSWGILGRKDFKISYRTTLLSR